MQIKHVQICYSLTVVLLINALQYKSMYLGQNHQGNKNMAGLYIFLWNLIMTDCLPFLTVN